MLRKQFSFDVNLQQAYKSPEGKMHVVGIASDDMEDRTGDRMSLKAINSMVRQAKQSRLPLLDNHKSTFGFGHTFDASAKRVKKGDKTVTQLAVDFELDERYPQAQDLFNEVNSGKAEKQLSIGGFLPTDNPKAVAFENNGSKVVRRIDEIMLEHIATTRPGMAAVPRTKFVGAIIKDIFGDDDNLPDAWQQNVGEEIERQVEDGATEGVVGTPAGPVDFQLLQKQSSEGQKTIVVMLDASKIAGQTETKEVAKEEGLELESVSEVAEETNESAAAVTTEEEKSMADPETSTVEQPEAGENNAAIRGLSVLTTIGKAFDATNKTETTETTETTEKSVPEVVIQPEIVELAKGFDLIANLELNEKSAAEARRILQGMAKLLELEVGPERAATDSAFTMKSLDEFAAKIEKSVEAKLAEVLEKSTETVEGAKTSTDVIEVFEKSFEGLTTELAKGLVEMGEGFKTLLHKSVEDTQASIAQLEKSSDERLAKLEKAAGVRQSMPTQAPEVATGAQTAATATPQVPGSPVKKSVRAPDAGNPFRGAFDHARASYMSSHR